MQMRMRLEKEQGPANPLKAGRGGYYDIDFALMYLRLKGAGIFFKVLNTPARIDVIEKMGHLERHRRQLPARRRHLLPRRRSRPARQHRPHRGRSARRAGPIRNSHRTGAPLDARHLHDQPLDIELAQIQPRTRELFNRLFSG